MHCFRKWKHIRRMKTNGSNKLKEENETLTVHETIDCDNSSKFRKTSVSSNSLVFGRVKMGKIEWAMWANEQAVASSIVVFVGGLLSWIGKFKKWQIAVYAVVASILIFVIEYPRGKRQKGRTKERICQRFLTPVVKRLGPFGRNYYFRFVFYLGLSIPCGFLLSTILGGACLCISSIIYLVAALAGEEWKPCIVSYETGQENTSLPEAPDQPPPRLHQVNRSTELLHENTQTA